MFCSLSMISTWWQIYFGPLIITLISCPSHISFLQTLLLDRAFQKETDLPIHIHTFTRSYKSLLSGEIWNQKALKEGWHHPSEIVKSEAVRARMVTLAA